MPGRRASTSTMIDSFRVILLEQVGSGASRCTCILIRDTATQCERCYKAQAIPRRKEKMCKLKQAASLRSLIRPCSCYYVGSRFNVSAQSD
jgi:hypothetical protein